MEVADGYARNYLIPNKLAVLASNHGREILADQKKDRQREHEDHILDAKKLAEKIESLELSFDVKVGKDGRVFGSVSTKQIEAALKNQHDIIVDKRKFKPSGPVQNLGTNRIEVGLYDSVTASLKVILKAQA